MDINEIRNILVAEVERLSGTKLSDMDEDIFLKNNVIDSMSVIGFIVFVEQKFNVEVDAFFDDRESAGSINKLAGLIQDKLKNKSDKK